ncbi:alpha/beta fold hydrolase [Leifsonia shinshuensis]|uniref:Alpha/beta hydrolase n=1 Tax=Leifsonia shinshuensis TaxID=150026 RepID=A0A7G6YBA9_9MICO|nr:alpha/beta hydrolase [Leifsonia shinshuensis]QNE35774.1 alpha/beta hydrolase [Leifsonia shinshuensis]
MPDLTLSRAGAALSYDVTGDGPTVLQAHGLTSSRDADLDLLDLRRLAEHGRRLVRYDAAGHGRSAGPDDPERYRWTTLADDLFAVLDAVGQTEPVDAVGISMGTGTILTAAVRHPERFRRLVLGLPPTAWETRPAQAAIYGQMADLLETQGWDALMSLMAASALALPPVLAERGVTPEPQLQPATAPAVLRGAALSDLPSPKRIATLRMPVLLLPWAGDAGHPLSTAERLHELIPGSELFVAESAADADTWPERVEAFLG